MVGGTDVADEKVTADTIVRVFAHAAAWVRTLPPVPDGWTVSVTVSHDELATPAVADLERAGYRIAGVTPPLRPADAGFAVDLLVPDALRQAHPDWFAGLVRQSQRVFDLRFGPVRRLFGPVLDLHRGMGNAAGTTDGGSADR